MRFMQKMIHKIKYIYIIFTFSFIILGLYIGVFTYIKGEWRFSYEDVQINNIALCKGNNPESIYPQDGNITILPSSTKSVYVCGYLTTKAPISLLIYIIKEPEIKAISSNDPNDMFSQGFFSRQLFLPKYDREGDYRIDIYLFRNVIATKKFQVRSP